MMAVPELTDEEDEVGRSADIQLPQQPATADEDSDISLWRRGPDDQGGLTVRQPFQLQSPMLS